MVACECSIAGVATDRHGRTGGEVSGDSLTGKTGGKSMTRADKERAAIDRCYEVDIGDRVEIDTHDEGIVQGEVMNMLWRGDMGFRQPDAIEVKWISDTGAGRCRWGR